MSRNIKSIIARSLIIWLVTGIAVIIPNFSDFLNIAGALGASMIAFVLPPIMNIVEQKGNMTSLVLTCQWLIVAFGISGALYSIYTSVESMISAAA